MIHLDPNSLKVRKAKKEFHQNMFRLVKGRISKIHSLKNVDTAKIQRFFQRHILPELNNILIGDPTSLNSINQRLTPKIRRSTDIRKGIKHVFNYDLFISRKNKYGAYNLAEALDINTCIYCNRNYTSTVIRASDKTKITRPQFDHYFDKKRNPLLAISFFNLIPSCSVCNASLKGSAPLNLDHYLHPYIDDEINRIRFSYQYSQESNKGLRVKVLTADGSKERSTMDIFAIEEVYNSHVGELQDLIKTKQYFSDKYLELLANNLLKDIALSKKEMYRIVFGVEYDANKFVNRPLSKFKSDILKELGII